MNLADADGSDPLPICRSNREWLVDRYKSIESIALRYFSDDLPIKEGDRATDEKSLQHVRRCPRCRDWIHAIVPADVLERQSRLTKYCCAGMFVAVEEPQRSTNHLSFEMFRGEDPCWKIDGQYTFASYCPWCGKRLPSQPFVASS